MIAIDSASNTPGTTAEDLGTTSNAGPDGSGAG